MNKINLINTLHHFREREFTPLAAAATAASFAVEEGKDTESDRHAAHYRHYEDI